MKDEPKPAPLPDSISITWWVDDVAERAVELEIELTLDEQREILQRMDRQHDANHGICWEVIDMHITAFDSERSAAQKAEPPEG